MRQPFACIALCDIRPSGQLGGRHRSACVERLVEAQPVTDTYERDAQRSAEIIKHLPDKPIELRFIDRLCHRSSPEIAQLFWPSATGSTLGGGTIVCRTAGFPCRKRRRGPKEWPWMPCPRRSIR